MRKQLVILVILALLLVGVWTYAFTGWFDSNEIDIVAQLKQPRRGRDRSVYPVVFAFNSDFVLESVKVTEADPVSKTTPVPLWHLVYDEKAQQRAQKWAKKRPNRAEYPLTTQTFIYGRRIRGLKPAEEGQRAEPLTPDKTYRLIVEARSGRGEVKFKTQRVAER